MSSLLLRIEQPPTGERLLIRGYVVRQGEFGWHEDLGAEKELPRELTPVEVRGSPVPFENAVQETVLTSRDPAISPREAGRKLWHLLMDGPIGTWWSQQIAAAGTSGVRTVLDVRPAELKGLPWELMSPEVGRPVFRDDRHPWVRAEAPWSTVEELLVPVRVLVVVGDRTSPDLCVDEEVDAIHGCVREYPGTWHVDIVTAPNMATLRRRYDDVEPHILHVIGHATMRSDQYVLAMKIDERRQWALTVEDVAELPRPAPRLVVLNCCRTNAAAAEAASTWTFTEAFRDLGSAAVVTMQGDISSRASVAFTKTFYAELVQGEAVDVAAAHARLAISDDLRECGDHRSWALPSLTVATDPDRVLPVRAPVAVAKLDVPPYYAAFQEVSGYLDRAVERRRLLRGLDPEPGRQAPALLVFAGEPSVGTSAVARSTFLTLRLRGRNAVYVHLDGARAGRKLSWLQVLRLIRNRIWEWSPMAPHEARQRFDHDLAFLMEQCDPERWTPESSRPDTGEEFRSEGEHYREWIAKILVAFRRMLVEVAADGALLLALDSLRAIHDEDLEDVLAEHLLLPIAEGLPPVTGGGTDAAVRCLVCAGAAELSHIPDHILRRLGPRSEIGPFDNADVPRLLREHLARRSRVPTEQWTRTAEQLVTMSQKTEWMPGELKQLLSALELMLDRG